MQMDEQKLACGNAAKLWSVADIIVTVMMVGFAAVVFLGAFKEGVDAAAHIYVSAIILGTWLLLMVTCCRNYNYLHIRYSCTAEGITNSIRDKHRMLPVSEGVFCTCVPVKFYVRYGYMTVKYYLFSNKPFSRDLDDYAGVAFIRKTWKNQIWLTPACPEVTNWIQTIYGCESIAEYPKVTYFPPKV